MKLYKLETEQIISKNIDEVFDFFSRPENLSIITPPKMNFKILTPSPITMKEGALIDYTVNVLLFPIRWRTLITKYSPPDIFIDEQLKGPYSMWHHTHTFEKINDNQTLIKDVVLYGVPLGLLGRIIHFLYIRRNLNEIFSFRRKKIEEIFDN
ncbi:MAG: CDP-paratose 2-epimerase [Candidatus Marinimicrobia bacterium]|nr:CDP-paratose 2-epimerase [Candidatus Neomarinimicrobiota bacterium]|tara:strand:- start:7400 stop:7858 length:459 start_codon:yes stop_codon:yes gene_type:complete